MTYPHHAPARPGSVLPLILAGAALVMTGYLIWDRFLAPPVVVQPRPITPRGKLAEIEKVTIAIYEENRPSVVHITTERAVRTSFFSWGVVEGQGSGFVWDEQGHIVTNYHVVRGSERGRIDVYYHDGSRSPAAIVGAIPEQDIAVLRPLRRPREVRPILVGTAHDLKVGQMVFAIGNPFGLDQTLTTGVVSALNRSITSVAGTPIHGVIQVDAAINPGNSGGPLLDSSGRLIGMNTAIYSKTGQNSGIGFAVPVDTINQLVSRLLSGEAASAPTNQVMLGLKLVPVALPDDAPYPTGGAIFEVVPGYGAAEAGLRPFRITPDGYLQGEGDYLVAIDGKHVASTQEVIALLQGRRPGEKVRVRVLRRTANGYEVKDLDVELRARPRDR